MYRAFLTDTVDDRIHNPLGPFSFMNLNFLMTFAQPRDKFFFCNTSDKVLKHGEKLLLIQDIIRSLILVLKYLALED